jgi:hypothetical protein
MIKRFGDATQTENNVNWPAAFPSAARNRSMMVVEKRRCVPNRDCGLAAVYLRAEQYPPSKPEYG